MAVGRKRRLHWRRPVVLATAACICLTAVLSYSPFNSTVVVGVTAEGKAAQQDGGSSLQADTAVQAESSKQPEDSSSSSGSSKDSGSSAEAGSSQSGTKGGEGKPLLFFDVGRAYHHLPKCPEGHKVLGVGCDDAPCPVHWDWTEDRGRADVVIYNTLDGMASWPPGGGRPQGQLVTMFAMESGQYYPAIYDAHKMGANITADYRLDSDVPVTYYTRWEYPDLKSMPVPFAEKRKDGLLAAFISNCGAKNDRAEVLEQLIKILPDMVHSYGRCHHNKEEDAHEDSRPKSKTQILATYKFAFTPENSNDPSYVTEKIYHALVAGAVPVYIGAPDIHRFVPVPEAVIQVSDFKSVQELADYLKQAAADEAIYNKHIAWKQRPESEWSEDWKTLQRLTEYSAHCRMAMHVAGKPHQWQNVTR